MQGPAQVPPELAQGPLGVHCRDPDELQLPAQLVEPSGVGPALALQLGQARLEERVAAGEEPGAAPSAYKAALQGPLAAVGDGFFWTALRPAFGAAAVAGALLLGWPAVVAALLAYNAVHLWLRVELFRSGYRDGDGVVALRAVDEHLVPDAGAGPGQALEEEEGVGH